MTAEERQRLNVRLIRVSLGSALRYAAPAEAQLCRARARNLLAHVRGEATSPALLADIEALQAELDGDAIGQELGES